MSTTRLDIRRGRGFALVSAIFILVVLVALVAAITLFTSQSETGQVRDRFGSRAYQAARSGLDWGAYMVLDPRNTTATAGNAPLPNCPAAANPGVCPTAAAPSSSTLPPAWFAGTVLAGYAVTVQCSCADFAEAGRNVRVYQLRSTASFGSGVGAVERQVSARVSYCRDPNGNPANQPPYGCS
jgi:MSHA biogenesis protein MshP